LVQVPIRSDSEQEAKLLMPPDTIKAMLAWGENVTVEAVDEQAEQFILKYRDEGDLFAVQNTLTIGKEQGRFPTFSEVFPAGKPKLIMHFTADNLYRVMRYAKANIGESQYIRFDLYGEDQNVQITFINKDSQKVVFVMAACTAGVDKSDESESTIDPLTGEVHEEKE
jgi:hypothetical protein